LRREGFFNSLLKEGRARSLAGVILAGGSSRRMGRPKAALELDGEPFVARIARLMADSGVAPRVVVAGEHARDTWAALPASGDVVPLSNPAPDRGQLSSLAIALRWLLERAPECAGALVALVDHPAVAAGTYRALHAAFAGAAPPAAIFLPTHRGRRGHPVVFARALWSELLGLPDSAGARAAVRADPARVVEVPVDDPGILRDVDTPADLADLRAAGSLRTDAVEAAGPAGAMPPCTAPTGGERSGS
jgi:CTP:molybdopterin cytidylyltransferase MocA